jgi:hypothetical protein
MESEISAEESRTNIFDRSSATYPMLAKTLIERRENLRVTIASLESALPRSCAQRVASRK